MQKCLAGRGAHMSAAVNMAIAAGATAFAYILVVCVALYRRNVHTWGRAYVRQLGRRRALRRPAPIHVMFCFADHFEPRWHGADLDTERQRVAQWAEDYPRLCAGRADSDGCPPRHTFFFPSEEYRGEHIERLVDVCRRGFGEIEVHLHHDRDTSEGLRANLSEFLRRLAEHRALPVDANSGQPRFAFVHGNWALDNSRPDGRWCGVNDEISVLASLGCYADFTMPSAPDRTQTAIINSLYYAADDPLQPKSHDHGTPVTVGGGPSGELMMVQGPLGLRWKCRFGIPVPALENGDVRAAHPPTAQRVDHWIRTGIHVAGRPEWVFVKIHAHGAQEEDMPALLGRPVAQMFDYLESRYNDGANYRLHYVTAREMYNIARAAERRLAGNPGRFRDLIIPRPPYANVTEDAPGTSA
jgi:hypothetical protein